MQCLTWNESGCMLADMVKVHLDTDLGGDLDDLCALALLLRWPDIDLVGITTAAEERGRRAGYVRYVLQRADRPDVSNLRLLDERYPGQLARTPLVLMGGYPFPPRAGFLAWGPEMDYNVQVDPHSSQYVLTHASPLLVPLAVTVETALRKADLESLRQAGALGQLLAHQGGRWLDIEPQNAALPADNPNLAPAFINFQHDPLACAVAGGWDGVTIETLALTIVRQHDSVVTHQDPAGRPFRVVTAVRSEDFRAFWLDRVAQRGQPR
jgi:inosine-uridine nucleoside N-ribohydrolase